MGLRSRIQRAASRVPHKRMKRAKQFRQAWWILLRESFPSRSRFSVLSGEKQGREGAEAQITCEIGRLRTRILRER
eukprot:scaffold281221_cov31-Tisochrysis_lutea.AAC.2